MEACVNEFKKRFQSKERECEVCGNPSVHLHHVFGGCHNRKSSDKYYMMAWLCPYHHNMSDFGAHFDRNLDYELKRRYQAIFEEYGTREDFMKIFGRSWL